MSNEVTANPRVAKVSTLDEWRDYEARQWWDARRRGLALTSMAPDEARLVLALDDRYAGIVTGRAPAAP